jgi:hypothetical protein
MLLLFTFKKQGIIARTGTVRKSYGSATLPTGT